MHINPLAITLKFGDALGGFSKQARRLAEPDRESVELLSELETEPKAIEELRRRFGPALASATTQELVAVDDNSQVSLTPLGSYALASLKTGDYDDASSSNMPRHRDRAAAAAPRP
jgi:hypothetical protein